MHEVPIHLPLFFFGFRFWVYDCMLCSASGQAWFHRSGNISLLISTADGLISIAVSTGEGEEIKDAKDHSSTWVWQGAT